MAAEFLKQQATTNNQTLNLPDDLLSEILLKLPVRSLLLFKSVCKSWLNLIQSPNFIYSHNNRPSHVSHDPMLTMQTLMNKQTVLTLLLSDDETETATYNDDVLSEVITPSMAARVLAHDKKLKTFIKVDKLSLLGPCNGVFFVSDTRDAVMFNPATRRCRKIPCSPHILGCMSVYSYFFGFGLDPVCNDYKVVRLEEDHKRVFPNNNHYNDNDDDDDDDDDDNDDDKVFKYNDIDEQEPNDSFDDVDDDDDDVENNNIHDDNIQYLYFKIFIYSLSTNCWRELDRVMPSYTNRIDSDSLFFNGGLHWVGGDNDCVCSVLVFDLNKEKFKRFELPNRYYEEDLDVNLSVLHESLAFIVRRGAEYLAPDVDFAIWVMRRYGVNKSWRKLYNISSDVGIKRPLSFSNKGNFFFENKDGQLVSYNLKTRETKKLQVQGVRGSLHAFPYRESLVSLR